MRIFRATARALFAFLVPLILGCPLPRSSHSSPGARITLSRTEIRPGESLALSLRFYAPSAALPAVSWSASSGSILQSRVANEAVFTAPEEEGDCEIKAKAVVGDSGYEAEATIRVKRPLSGQAWTKDEYIEPWRIRNYLAVKSLMFADYTPLYLSEAEPSTLKPILFKLRLPAGIPGRAILRYQSSGIEPRSALMAKQRTDAACDYYQAEAWPSAFPFTYWFEWQDGSDALYLSGTGVSDSPPAAEDRFRLESGAGAPSWAKGAFMYRIVPDRFLNGDYANDPAGTRTDWNSEIKPQDAARAFGGDLEGMGRKLEYLRTLGVDGILVDPVFGADRSVESRYSEAGSAGPDADRKLADYLSRARARGLKVILDAPAPGAGDDPGGALVSFAETWCRRSTGNGLKAPILGGTDADAFYASLRDKLKSINAEAILLSPSRSSASRAWDLCDDPAAFLSPISVFLAGTDPLSPASRPVSPGDGSKFLRGIAETRAVSSQRAAFSYVLALDEPGTARLVTRIKAAEEKRHPKGENPVPESRWVSVYRLAAILQMSLPGSPVLLYGGEAALQGSSGEDSLRAYPWGRENKGTVSLYKDLGALRKAYPALKGGSYRALTANDSGLAAFARWDQKSRLIVAVNAGTEAQEIMIDSSLAGLQSGDRLKTLLAASENGHSSSGPAYAVKDSKLSFALAPRSGVILLCPVPKEAPPSVEKRPRLKRFFPADKAKDLSPDTRVIMEFTEVMDQGSIQEAFRVSPATPGSFVWNGNTCTFVPDRELDADTEYSIALGNELRSLSGGYVLKDRASFGFTVH